MSTGSSTKKNKKNKSGKVALKEVEGKLRIWLLVKINSQLKFNKKMFYNYCEH